MTADKIEELERQVAKSKKFARIKIDENTELRGHLNEYELKIENLQEQLNSWKEDFGEKTPREIGKIMIKFKKVVS